MDRKNGQLDPTDELFHLARSILSVCKASLEKIGVQPYIVAIDVSLEPSELKQLIARCPDLVVEYPDSDHLALNVEFGVVSLTLAEKLTD